MVFLGKLRNKILLITALSCLICLGIAVGVARHFNERTLHEGVINKARVNDLADNLEIQSSSDRHSSVERSFANLAIYAQTHFAHEEAYMESIRYPDLQSHKAIHKKLLDQVADFGAKIQNGDYDGSELMDFLNDWLMRHILGVDMKYGKYSNKNQWENFEKRVS